MSFFAPDKTRRELEKNTRDRGDKSLSRARILRSGVTVEDNSDEIRELLAKLQPKAVLEGKVEVEERSERHSAELRYSDSHYGLTKVETVEEMQQRHAREVAQLKQELETREKDAYEKGLAEGRAEGHEQGVGEVKDDFEQHIDLLTSLVQSAASQTKEYFAKVEENLVEFALEIARKIAGESALRYREVAVRMAGEALKLAIERTRVVLKCNPADLEALKQAKGDLMTISEGIKEIEVESSSRVEPGGVILETDAGSIDATIRTMLDELQQALLPEHSFGKAGYAKRGVDVTKGFEIKSPGFTPPPAEEEGKSPPADTTEEESE